MSEPGGRYFVGAETGGTFTDVVALDAASGALASFKVPSVPGDPARAVDFELVLPAQGAQPSAKNGRIPGLQWADQQAERLSA